MSMFSFPTDMSSETMKKSYDAMNGWMNSDQDILSPLAIQSAGAATVAAAMGLGVASQMTGMMMGLFQGMMGASLHGFSTDLFAAAKETEAAAPVERVKSAAARGAAKPALAASQASDSPTQASQAAVARLKSDAKAAAEAAVEPKAEVAKVTPALETPENALAPEDFRRPAEIEKPAMADDLKAIGGIGPKLEQVLNGLGVWTYAQIAAWGPNEAAWVDDYLQFKGRVERDEWIGQAKALAERARGEPTDTSGAALE